MIHTQALRKNFQFRTVYSRGKYLSDKLLTMYVLKNSLGVNRLGITVSKKVGKSVMRSRITRLIRENYRLVESKTTVGSDIVFVARNSASSSNFHELGESIIKLMTKHKVVL